MLLWVLLATHFAHIDNWLFATGLADIRAFWRGGSAPFSHFLIGGTLNATTGWLVGRVYHRHKVAMVSAFFLSFVLLSDIPRVIDVGTEAARTGEPPWRGLGICLLDFAFMTVPILLAGIWCVRDAAANQIRVGRAGASA